MPMYALAAAARRARTQCSCPVRFAKASGLWYWSLASPAAAVASATLATCLAPVCTHQLRLGSLRLLCTAEGYLASSGPLKPESYTACNPTSRALC
jgi:hypothetical protein